MYIDKVLDFFCPPKVHIFDKKKVFIKKKNNIFQTKQR